MKNGANFLSESVFLKPLSKTAAVVVVLIQVACASSSPEQKAGEISGPSRPFAVLPEAPPALPPPPPIRDLPATAPKSVKVISEGAEEAQPSLIEASRMAKARKKNSGESRPVIEITDENLKEFSSGGQIFVLEAGEPGAESATPESAGSSKSELPAVEFGPRAEAPSEGVVAAERSPEAERELFWRQSVSEVRGALRYTLDALRRLELESSMLRQQFYSEADPFVRDSEIKPRWDRTLDQLHSLRMKVNDDRGALSSLLAEAKRAGISPDWLEIEDALKLIEEAGQLIENDGQPKQ